MYALSIGFRINSLLVETRVKSTLYVPILYWSGARYWVGYFIYTLKLCCIKDDILSTFYGTPKIQTPLNGLQDRPSNLDFTAMVELDRRVNEFEATLPSWLMPSAY